MRNVSALIIGVLVVCSSAFAQTSEIAVSEGVSGDIDAKRRGPVLSTSFSIDEALGRTKILADAYLPNGEFAPYPIRFDFFVSRELFASQIRATEQPGPVGIDVPYTKAAPPYDFSVVATLLHPNRQFTTTHYGRVELQTPATPTPGGGDGGTAILLNCTLSQALEGKDFAADDVTISGAAGSYSFEFTGTDTATGATATVSGSISAASADTASGSGTVSVTPQGASATTVQVTGNLGYNADQVLNEIGVSSSDDNVSLECCETGGACGVTKLL